MDAVAFGTRIRQARDRLGISQEELAARISRDQRAVSEIENGKRRVAVTELPNIARALEVPILYFFEGEIDITDEDRALITQYHRLESVHLRQTALEIIRLLGDALEKS